MLLEALCAVVSNGFCPLLPRLCGNYAPSYNLTFLSSQNVMLVTLVTNKEGRFPGFKAEFFQLPKMKGEQRPWPQFSPLHLSLPRATEAGGAAVAAVGLPAMFPGPGDLGSRSHLGACLARGALGCCNDVPPEEGKIRIMLD